MILYRITRYNSDGSVRWERFSRVKNPYHAARGEMLSFPFYPSMGGRITLDKIEIPSEQIMQIASFDSEAT